MIQVKKYSGFLVALFGATVLFMGIASAHDFRSGTSVVVEQAAVIDNSIFVAGRTIDINAEVFGDVFCAGQTITVSGTVHGDVICGGQTITISGIVDGDVRLAGQTVTLQAAIAGNATIAGETFTQSSSSEIGGDLTAGSNDIILNGRIGRDVAVGGGNVILTGEVGRNIKGDVNQLELFKAAKVGGNIAYTSTNDINDAGASVAGLISRTDVQQSSNRGEMFGLGLAWFIFLFVSMLLVAMAIALMFPAVLRNVTDRALPRPWRALLVGLVASIVVPVLLVIVAVTIVGLPLAFLLGLLWLLVSMLSGPFSGYYLGRLLLKNSQHTLKIMLVGSSALLVLYFIPFVGFFALITAYWIGSGMILLELTRRTPRPLYATTTVKTKATKKKLT